MHHSIASLLHKHMDRREFLRTLLIIVLTCIGLGIIAKNIQPIPTTSGSAMPAKPQTDGEAYGKN